MVTIHGVSGLGRSKRFLGIRWIYPGSMDSISGHLSFRSSSKTEELRDQADNLFLTLAGYLTLVGYGKVFKNHGGYPGPSSRKPHWKLEAHPLRGDRRQASPGWTSLTARWRPQAMSIDADFP